VPSYFADRQRTRVFVSFGTVVARAYPAESTDILVGIARGLAAMPGVDALISLGNAEPGHAARKGLAHANVRVEAYLDQRAVLREADCFITHQGINSTHEAIDCGVPMISVPFFWDQPALAATCQRMGIAVPLGNTPCGPVTPQMIQSALNDLTRNAPSCRAALQRARGQEYEVIAGRPAVFERVLNLASVTPSP
jgi:UDP:flavonoid glycosyltransferase YjiC (YdhE family)